MVKSPGFSQRVVASVHDERILGIRAGIRPHRFLAIWAVVVDGRVFVRPWNDRPDGWHRAFLEEPRGTIQVAGREIPVRARRAWGERLMDAIDQAYAAKYPTPGSRKYVRGFARPRRRATTMELVRRSR